jgi:peptidoglycan/xylan/chitin deacetylase (PgdA/CDA1 family)
MFHAIGTKVKGDRKQLYNLSERRFVQQMQCLAAAQTDTHLKVVSLQTGIVERAGLAITFDDGYSDTLTRAAPILAELDIPFTVFVAPSLISSGDRRYLSIGGLKELARFPRATIGAHGYSHRPLVECTNSELKSELSNSKAWLEEAVGSEVEVMSYPHGAVDARVREAAADAGFKVGATSKFGAVKNTSDSLLIPRIDIWAQDSIERFKAKTLGRWDWMGWVR